MDSPLNFGSTDASFLLGASFKEIFNQAAVGMGQLDPITGQFLLVNSKLCQMTGYSEEELLKKRVIDLTPAEERLQFSNETLRLVQGKIKESQIEKKFIRPNGEIIHFQISTSLIKSVDGSPLRLFCIFQDVSLHRHREAILSSALDAAQVGVWVWDVKTGKITWSDPLEKLFGLEPGSFSGGYEEYMQLIHPEFRESLNATVQRAIETKQPYEVEHRVLMKSGEERWLLGKGKAFYDSAGALVKMTGTTIDITERKKQEKRLLQKTEELDRFAAVAAHDLKAPLNSITQFTELLAEDYRGRLDSEADQYIDFIVKSGHRMRALIDSLLAYSRAMDVKTWSWREVPLAEILDAVQKNLLTVLKNSNAEIRVDHNLPIVQANEIQLIQLMQNLISNAIKYCDSERNPIVQIECQDQGTFWQISVKDNGIGIDEKNLSKIFDFFQRVGPQDQQEGSGIGLAVCKKIVENHGGSIWVDSSLGQGSRFFFTLPKIQKP